MIARIDSDDFTPDAPVIKPTGTEERFADAGDIERAPGGGFLVKDLISVAAAPYRSEVQALALCTRFVRNDGWQGEYFAACKELDVPGVKDLRATSADKWKGAAVNAPSYAMWADDLPRRIDRIKGGYEVDFVCIIRYGDEWRRTRNQARALANRVAADPASYMAVLIEYKVPGIIDIRAHGLPREVYVDEVTDCSEPPPMPIRVDADLAEPTPAA